jgi:hypothetical protein
MDGEAPACAQERAMGSRSKMLKLDARRAGGGKGGMWSYLRRDYASKRPVIPAPMMMI